MKKNKVMVALLLAFCLAFTMVGCGGGTANESGQHGEMSWQGQYDLGIRLLNSGDYENAILAFQSAIQIDPKKVDAYLGLADVYLAMDDPQAAVDALSLGWNAVTDLDRTALAEKQQEISKKHPDVVINNNGTGGNGSDEGTNGSASNNAASDEIIFAMEEYIAAQFDYAGEFHEGRAVVGLVQAEGTMKYYYIDTEGEIIAGPYDYAADFHEGRAAVGNRTTVSEDKWYSWRNCYYYGYIDASGNEVIPLQYLLDDEWTQGLSFYDGLAEVNWFSDEKEMHVWTNLVDKDGNKVLPTDILVVDERGYGGGDEWIDYRLMQLLAPARDSYYCYNSIQQARCAGKLGNSNRVYNGTETLWLDQNLEIVDRQVGYVSPLSSSPELYLVYDGSPTSYFNTVVTGKLVDGSGNVILEGFSNCKIWHGEYLHVTYTETVQSDAGWQDQYTYKLYTLDGEEFDPGYQIYSATGEGYLVQENYDNNTGTADWIVLDQNFVEVLTVRARGVYQASESIYDNGSWRNQWLPLYQIYDYVDGKNVQYYVDANGQRILDAAYDENQRLEYTLGCIIANDGTKVILCEYDGTILKTIEGINCLYSEAYYGVSNEDLYVGYFDDGTYDNERENFYYQITRKGDALEVKEVDAVYLEESYITVLAEDLNKETVIRRNDVSALIGLAYNRETPLTVEYQGSEIAKVAAASLVSNGLYKTGASFVYDNYSWSYQVNDVSLHAVESDWSSAVYENMGYLSENFISFRIGGKWGYLKVVH